MVLAAAALLFPLQARAQAGPHTEALREAILRTNPELAARRAAVQAAEARGRAAGFAAPAVLSGEAEEIPGIDLRDASVRVEVERELLSRGRRDAARAVAAADVRAAAAALSSAERRLAALATRALTQEAGWSAIARRLGAEDSLLVSAEAALRARFSVGDARYVDVLRLRTERLRVQSERAEAVAEARAGRVALEALLGPAPAPEQTALLETALAEAAGRAPTTALPPPPDVDSLLAQSGAIRLAEAEVERARAGRQLLLAEQRPRLAGTVGVQRFPSDGGGSTLGPTLGASVSLPFTARRANATATEAAAADVAAAEAERAATTAAVRAELVAARERYEAARTRLAVYDAALLRGAREEREAALASFRTGDLSLIELLDFERALARAETERLRSVLDAADALADLLAAGSGAGAPDHDETTSRTGGSHDR
ncbi:MAG TPA: TolC family protein [Longimicrobiaceae bacterium]